jgi:hypothetical protein
VRGGGQRDRAAHRVAEQHAALDPQPGQDVGDEPPAIVEVGARRGGAWGAPEARQIEADEADGRRERGAHPAPVAYAAGGAVHRDDHGAVTLLGPGERARGGGAGAEGRVARVIGAAHAAG